MEIDEIIDELQSFLETSKTFGSITFKGCYDMGLDKFLLAFAHFLESGENVLDEYSDLIYLSWESSRDHGPYFNKDRRSKISRLIKNDGFWNIYSVMSEDEIEHAEYLMSRSEALDKHRETYKYKRKMACNYTSNPETRKRIFERDGKSCKECGTTENLQLDHIIPISKGGKNEYENLQVLCASCNASKSDKMPNEA